MCAMHGLLVVLEGTKLIWSGSREFADGISIISFPRSSMGMHRVSLVVSCSEIMKQARFKYSVFRCEPELSVC